MRVVQRRGWAMVMGAVLALGACSAERRSGPPTSATSTTALATSTSAAQSTTSTTAPAPSQLCAEPEPPGPADTLSSVEELTGVTAIAAGNTHFVVAREDGTVWTWDYDEKSPSRVRGLCNITALAAAYAHSVALRADGTVWRWPVTYSPDLPSDPPPLLLPSGPTQILGLDGVVSVASALGGGSAVRRDDGSVWFFDGGAAPYVASEIEHLDGAAAISMGFDLHATLRLLAIRLDGSVWESSSQDGDLTRVDGLSNVIAIAAGWGFNIALRDDGSLWRWGTAYFCSENDATPPDRSVPELVPEMTDVVAISAGSLAYALRSDGTVWAWGMDAGSGFGGLPKSLNCNTPVQWPNLEGVVAIAAGGFSNLALLGDGTVATWEAYGGWSN